MRIVTKPDVIEISNEDLLVILREAVLKRHGRVLDRITWTNIMENQNVEGRLGISVNLNATLKPESDK
jgi:hypothetical protein